MLSNFKLFGINVNTYWFVVFLGMLAMCAMNIRRRDKLGISKKLAAAIGFYMTLAGIIGAKILFILEDIPNALENGITLSGVSFFGTVFFLPAALLPFAALAKCRRAEFLDFCTPPVLLMLSCIRIGCFLCGCCGGVAFHAFGLEIAAIPTQLIECCADLAIMYILLKQPQKIHGLLYPSFMVMYGAARFLIEFMRVREVRFWAMSNGHLFALASVIIGACIYIIEKRKNLE